MDVLFWLASSKKGLNHFYYQLLHSAGNVDRGSISTISSMFSRRCSYKRCRQSMFFRAEATLADANTCRSNIGYSLTESGVAP
jgi:hypothetical protein